MRGRIDGVEYQPKAHRFATPHSSDCLLTVSDKCLSSLWFTVQLCWVHAGWGPQRHVNTQWSMHPPRHFYSLSCGQWGQASGALCCEISFHALRVYWFLLVFRQNQSRYCQKAKSPLHSLSWKGQKQSEEVCRFFPLSVDVLDDCASVQICVCVFCHGATLPLLLEAWVSASFGVRKRRGSLSGLVPDMLMDWTCTM